MSRKFSDSEIRAYTKNRHEEKILRSKLDKLKVDMGTFHDSSTKQRQDLVAECKDIRMTSGGSPVPKHVIMDADFDISKRVQRPWAYSVMETTYNAIYRDAIIPLPKQKRRGPKSIASQRGMTPRSFTSSMESKSALEQSIKGTASHERLVSSPDSVMPDGAKSPVNHNQQMHSSHSVKLETHDAETSEAAGGDGNAKGVPQIVVNSDNSTEEVTQAAGDIDEHVNRSGSLMSPNSTRTKSHFSFSLTEDEDDLSTYRSTGVPISLPPVYKIDSQSYQDAERARLIQRSRSRVSFSPNHVTVSDNHGSGKEKVKTQASPEVSITVVEQHETGKHYESEQVLDKTIHKETSKADRGNIVMTLDPESYHDLRTRRLNDVLFKGKRLKNYIHPEERYKIDPIIMKRRQNKMDKLAKESVSFLQRVNHENIKVEIAFPRSARKRILLKLVEENNSVKGRRVNDEDGPIIQKKVEYFMSSISDYIKQQQFEREQTFT